MRLRPVFPELLRPRCVAEFAVLLVDQSLIVGKVVINILLLVWAHSLTSGGPVPWNGASLPTARMSCTGLPGADLSTFTRVRRCAHGQLTL